LRSSYASERVWAGIGPEILAETLSGGEGPSR